MTYRIMLLVELTKLSDMSDNRVVISLYSRFFGKLSIKGTMALPHLMRPRPESTLVM